jgi:hypothetical protein
VLGKKMNIVDQQQSGKLEPLVIANQALQSC